jgi:hypothetical protein
MASCSHSTAHPLFTPKRFRIQIPAGSRHPAQIDLETAAYDERDARHLVLCMLGKTASIEAVIVELGAQS